MLESISLVRVRLSFGTNCRPRLLMWLLSLRLLQRFARAIYVVICYRPCIYLFLGIDLSVRVPVYTFTCTYFYCLVGYILHVLCLCDV